MGNIIRPTTLGMAFVNAAAKTIGTRSIDKVVHDPKVNWVVRRIAVSQSKIGLIREWDSHHNFMSQQERDEINAQRRAAGIY